MKIGQLNWRPDIMKAISIDGALGEGGGQILRTGLTLACITGKPVHIYNIRAARPKPGLAKQHISCVKAAAEISTARYKGAELGSQVLDFEPGEIRPGNYHFDIGSAGSASLVIQTVLPVLFLAGKPSKATVTGGTHNPWAPPFDFLCETFLPAIALAGFQADCRLLKYGFFPAGGGKIEFDIQPWDKKTVSPIDLCRPDKERKLLGRIYTAKLPSHIAERQRRLVLDSGLNIEKVEHIDVTDSDSAGNCVMVRLCGSERTTVFTAFGMKGRPSEKVVGEVVDMARAFLTSSAAIDSHLADQLLIYMALQKCGRFTTNELSKHLTTNLEVIKKFLSVDFAITGQGTAFEICCRGI
jgi:RNA 3'-terminal phosphate cyclase (ATP)